MKESSYRIGFIGSGNVANHLAPVFADAGHRIVQVISRSAESARALAEPFGADYGDNPVSLISNLDIVFLTVPDHVLPEIIDKIGFFKGRVAHTSGAVSIDIFGSSFDPRGVFYPLQTFSKNRKLDFRKVPVFVEANSREFEKALMDLANQISENVYALESEKRSHLHLAAVFANNFTNYLLTASNDILEAAGIEKDVMYSLVRETLEKSMTADTALTQTGPAVRGDIPTIKKHLKLLSFSPELSRIYQCLTESIQKYYSVGPRNK